MSPNVHNQVETFGGAPLGVRASIARVCVPLERWKEQLARAGWETRAAGVAASKRADQPEYTALGISLGPPRGVKNRETRIPGACAAGLYGCDGISIKHSSLPSDGACHRCDRSYASTPPVLD